MPRTQASALAAEIRRDIISGALAPGTRLRTKSLADRYGTSAIPVREALSRLASSGLVIAEDQRGFFVPLISARELRELTTLRETLETRALRESIAAGDINWETNLVTTHHRLSRLPEYSSTAGMTGFAEDWDIAHRAFHHALLAACSSSWLMQLVNLLSEQINRYRHLSALRGRADRNVPAEHQAIFDAAMAHDSDRACEILVAHILKTESLALAVIENRGYRDST